MVSGTGVGAVVGGAAIAVSVPLVVEGVIATTVGLSTALGSINNFSSDWEAYNGYKGGTDTKLLDELASSGMKYNPNNVVAVFKNSDGKLMWLEVGNNKAGLTHILERHADDFISKGINDVPDLLEKVLSTNPVKTGRSTKGLFADYVFDGNSYRVAYGTNGFIVSFYPID